jgi:hypothetical protein
MKEIIVLILLCMASISIHADNAALYELLDSVVANRAAYTKKKEVYIAKMIKAIPSTKDINMRLQLYDNIYNEYHYLRFDSAMAYVKRGLEVAEAVHNDYYTQLFILHKAALLSSAGLYSEAYNLLYKLDDRPILPALAYEYNLTLYWLYTYWSDYTMDSEYRGIYWGKKLEYLRRTVKLAKDRPNDYNYLMGEYEMYVTGNHAKALQYYLKVLRAEPNDTRLYSTACFATACCYQYFKQYDKYETYLIRTAITDIIAPVKENLSLYTVAGWLFSTDGDIKRAETYVSVSIEDAKFYNNRLRIISSTDKLPEIVSRFKDKLNAKNRKLRWALGTGIFLFLTLIIAAGLIVRQNGLLVKRRKQIARQNDMLVGLNGELSVLNGQLRQRNENLVDVNQHRENLAKLYIDLCSKYIDRLNSYQKFVVRKIKVNQINDLLSTTSSPRLTEADAATFLNGFDKAFIDLYPTFIKELNELLLPGNEVRLKDGNMSTELRIFALIRLGVKDSSEIANLLFCTPRTIYNYRSALKAKAKNRETFEDDVRKLCTV